MTRINEEPINLIISGVGGQGNILLSRMIGRALLKKGYLVSIGETLGVAQRGGSVMSSVRISETLPVGPLTPEGKAHLIVSMEPLETLRMLSRYGNPEVTTITNFRPLFPVDVLTRKDEYPDYAALRQAIENLSGAAFFVEATETALRLGTPIITNVIMLGALVGLDMIPLTREDIESEIKANFSGDRAELNLKALACGIDSVAART